MDTIAISNNIITNDNDIRNDSLVNRLIIN